MHRALLLLRQRLGRSRLQKLAVNGYFCDGISSFTSLSGAISSWAPIVGVDAATQATGSKQPAISTLNGHPAALFDGVDDTLQTAAFSTSFSPPFTIIAVVQRTGATGGTTRGIYDGIASGNRACLTHQGGDDTAHIRGSALTTTGLASSTNSAVYRCVFNGVNSYLYLNGVAAPIGDVGTSTLTGLTLGAVFNGTSNQFPGKIAAYLLIPGAINGDVRAIEAERLLMVRYGIQPIQVFFEGDSRSTGTWPAQSVLQAETLSSKQIGYPTSVDATGGKTVATMITDGPTQIDANRRLDLVKRFAVIWGGLNDDANGVGANYTTINTRLQTWAAARIAVGIIPIICTEIDCQSVGGLVRWHTDYPSLNTLIRASGIRVADLGADARLQDATNGTYFNADKTHLVTAGYDIVWGIVGAALAAAVA